MKSLLPLLSNGLSKQIYVTHSEVETRELAIRFAQTLDQNSIICLFGDLGTGKTTFVKGLREAFAIASEASASSPTFSYLNIYPGTKTIYHFDLYRLKDTDEFLAMGFDEYFFADGICCVEWAERIETLLPPHAIRLTLIHDGQERRRLVFENHDKKISI